jgi:hypothetical protein
MAFLLEVFAQVVLTWIRDMARNDDEKPESMGRTIIR